MRQWLLAFALIILPGPAVAEPSAAELAFNHGDYAIAAELAAAHKSADGEALRARALLAAEVVAGGDPDPAQITQAINAAEQSLSYDPAHIEGRLQLAIGLAFEARGMPLRVLARSDHGRRARRLAESVLDDDADNTYALGFLAIWHIEAVRRAGRFAGGLVGARVSMGRAYYHRAAELAPDDASLHWQYARALAALNARRYRDEIETALVAATAASVDTALEDTLQSRARVLQTALGLMSDAEIEALAARML